MTKYIAEFIGTFILSLTVLVVLSEQLGILTPIVIALTQATLFYTIGKFSGAHTNPAVTIGHLSLKRIKPKEALMYIFAQSTGAFLAFVVVQMPFLGYLVQRNAPTLLTFDSNSFLGEMIGTALYTFGIASVVTNKKVTDSTAMTVIGSSLFLGTIVSSSLSSSLLNPAIAFSVKNLTLSYLLGPIIGSVLGFQIFRVLNKFYNDEVLENSEKSYVIEKKIA